jgi:hypothetical protein
MSLSNAKARALLAAAIWVVPLAPCATAQQTPAAPLPSYRGRLLGVYDAENGNPVEGVRVSDVLSGTSALTTATGTVSLVFVPDGGGLVRLQRIGYETQTTFVSISPRDTTPVTLAIRRVTQLPTVVTTDSAPHYVSPALRGFLERSKREAGYFIDEVALRKNENRTLADVMRARMPGAQFHEGNNGSVFLLKSPRCIEGGPPQVYVDGVPISPDSIPQLRNSSRGGALGGQSAQPAPSIPPFDLSRFQVTELGAVEWYPDGEVVPIEFSHTSKRCGALLLWTRER